MKIAYRPMDEWPGRRTEVRHPALFRITDTPALLQRELALLTARTVEVYLDVADVDLRLDGPPRAKAKVGFSGVMLTFESRLGPLQFVCDNFPDWRENLGAIALTLESLRRVSRYGVVSAGEPYVGFRPAVLPVATAMDVEDAAIVIAEEAEDPLQWPDVVTNRVVRRNLYDVAARKLHRDTGGGAERLSRLRSAYRVLETG